MHEFLKFIFGINSILASK